MAEGTTIKTKIAATIMIGGAFIFGYFAFYQNPVVMNTKNVQIASNTTSNDERQDLQQEKALLQAGKYNEAIQFLGEILKKDDKNPVIYNDLGVAYMGLNQFDKAMEHLNKAITLEPQNYVAYKLMGDCQVKLKKEDLAIVSYEKSISTNKQMDVLAYPELIYLLHNAKNDEACMKYIQEFEDRISKNPSFAKGQMNVIAYQVETQIYFDKKEYQKALESCNKILGIDPNDNFATKSKPIIEQQINK